MNEAARPDILEVIGRYTPLRKIGREYIGASPCHNDRRPSLRVNSEKQVWYCDPCASGGDVIRFIELVEKVSFQEAIAILGIDNAKPRPRRSDRLLVEAHKLALWANAMTAKAEYLLREIGQRARLAKETNWTEELRHLSHEWAILESLAEDLQHEDRVLELYRQRRTIENILAESVVEPLPEFPELTSQYWRFVSELPKPPEQEIRKHG